MISWAVFNTEPPIAIMSSSGAEPYIDSRVQAYLGLQTTPGIQTTLVSQATQETASGQIVVNSPQQEALRKFIFKNPPLKKGVVLFFLRGSRPVPWLTGVISDISFGDSGALTFNVES